ncbi:MAG: hypothetical protein SVW02_01530 [Candidatus Nanohaloarchaea archaeon]|nr:hypothetical protein [Candidatus Nanohaloarchaea archaeon]
MKGFNATERLSLLLVLGGLSVMYVSSVLASPAELQVSTVDEGDTGDMIRVTGRVTDYTVSDGTQFFRIKGREDEIRAVYFEGGLPVTEGQRYTFEGRVKMYEGALELVIADVTAVSGGSNQG